MIIQKKGKIYLDCKTNIIKRIFSFIYRRIFMPYHHRNALSNMYFTATARAQFYQVQFLHYYLLLFSFHVTGLQKCFFLLLNGAIIWFCKSFYKNMCIAALKYFICSMCAWMVNTAILQFLLSEMLSFVVSIIHCFLSMGGDCGKCGDMWSICVRFQRHIYIFSKDMRLISKRIWDQDFVFFLR